MSKTEGHLSSDCSRKDALLEYILQTENQINVVQPILMENQALQIIKQFS